MKIKMGWLLRFLLERYKRRLADQLRGQEVDCCDFLLIEDERSYWYGLVSISGNRRWRHGENHNL